MCGGTPKVETRDLAGEKLAADRVATQRANSEIASRRGKRQSQSLIANPGGAAGLSGGSVIAQTQGKQTLG